MENILNYFNNKMAKRIKGFTLIEILVVVAIFSIVVFAGLPMIRGVVYQNDLDNSTTVIVSTLRQAENSARNGINDSPWGVRINYPLLILFRGSSYALRDTSMDLNYTLNSNITMTGLSEIVYSKMDAIPSTTGDITITNLNNISLTININAKGRLSY